MTHLDMEETEKTLAKKVIVTKLLQNLIVDDVLYEVRAQSGCSGCAFHVNSLPRIIGACVQAPCRPDQRKDHRSVTFVKKKELK